MVYCAPGYSQFAHLGGHLAAGHRWPRSVHQGGSIPVDYGIMWQRDTTCCVWLLCRHGRAAGSLLGAVALLSLFDLLRDVGAQTQEVVKTITYSLFKIHRCQ